ncbi:MAG: hypothetical protein H7838_11285 [Magnetococcus sp. DMHC-8]
MKRLLSLTVLMVLLAPGWLWADKEGTVKERGQEGSFEKAKARRVEDLKAMLTCVEAAQNREAMKNCREQISKKHEMQEKQQKLQKIQEQKKRLEEQERRIQQGDAGR